jgi:hypothetical protein
MAQVRKRRKSGTGRTGCRPAESSNATSAVMAHECKPGRGVKLKTVSALTLLFALASLAAFVAGRPPISAAGPLQRRELAPMPPNQGSLRHDDAGSFLRGGRGRR